VSERRSTRPSGAGTPGNLYGMTPPSDRQPPREQVDPVALVALAAELARRAGALLVDGLLQHRSEIATKSSATDMVTEIDRASERQIVDGILAARPHDGVIGEEGTDRPGTSGVRWIVDPLDGTTNYLYRHPGFAVSIAVEMEGETVAGAVFDPLHDQLFTATLRGGAFLAGEPIAASAQTDLGATLVATGFGYDARTRAEQASLLVQVLPHVRDIRRMGAASVDLCSVACGRVDAYYERGLAPWDLAAGALIASEAGALVSGLRGEDLRTGSVLAASPGIAEPLARLLDST
jgi:myo-inositol-1(or 4)-monophosphatase